MVRYPGLLETKSISKSTVRNILILAQEKLGDAILLTPLLKNLKRHVPGVQIHVACFGSNDSFFQSDPHVDYVFSVKRNWFRAIRFAQKMHYDVLFNPKDHPSVTFLIFTLMSRAKFRLGIEHEGHEGFYHDAITFPFETHLIYKNCALLQLLGIPEERIDYRPYLPDGPVSGEVESFTEKLIPGEAIGINLSAGEPDREWPLAKWRALISRLNQPIVVFATDSKIKEKKLLERAYPHVISSPFTASIFDAGRILSKLRLLITPDTSLVHVAACIQVPVLGLYRSLAIHYQRFAPFQVTHRRITSETHLVQDISVIEVNDTLLEMLDTIGSPVHEIL